MIPSSQFCSFVLYLSWKTVMGSLPQSSWYKPTSFSWVDTAFQMSELLLHNQGAHHNGKDISWFLLRPWHTHPTGLGHVRRMQRTTLGLLKINSSSMPCACSFLFCSVLVFIQACSSQWCPVFYSSLRTQLRCLLTKPPSWMTYSSLSTPADALRGGLRGQGRGFI